MTDDDTIDVPREQFLKFVLPHIAESDVKWNVSDEVAEQINYTDLADPSNVTYVGVSENDIEIELTLSASESERVSRGSRMHPPEYKNHDVTVHVRAYMEWPEDLYELGPYAEMVVDQVGGRPRPDPDVAYERMREKQMEEM